MGFDPSSFEVRRANWPADEAGIRHVREIVFVQEQEVPSDLEWDGSDDECVHALAEAINGDAIGTGRLAPDGKIGRMAVLRPFRNAGVGARILAHLMDAAREAGLRRCYLHSQVHAVDFYARHGFTAHGPEFMEADIPHREMVMEIEDE